MDFDYKRHNPLRHRRCLVVTLTVVISLSLLLLLLALTVFRPRHAVTAVNSIKLSSFNAGFDVPNLSVDVNITLALNVTVFNPNAVRFRYPDGGAGVLYYGDKLAGNAAIPAGEIAAKGTETIDVVLTVLAGRFVGNAEVYVDVVKGSLDLTVVTRIEGKVAILGMFKHRVVSYSNCDARVDVRNRSVANFNCRYKTKL